MYAIISVNFLWIFFITLETFTGTIRPLLVPAYLAPDVTTLLHSDHILGYTSIFQECILAFFGRNQETQGDINDQNENNDVADYG